jgi:membrane-associated phospholipid phosphatase
LLLQFNDGITLFKAINTGYTSFLDMLMPFITMMGEAWFIIIVLLLVLGKNEYRNWWYVVTATICNVIPSVLVQVFKSAFDAPRPLKLLNEVSWIHTLPEWPRLMERSFPSGHTCGAFSLFCFLAMLLPHKHRWLGILFFLLALCVAYSRIYLAAHFFEDVYAGSIFGTLSCLTVVTIMNKTSRYFFAKQS